MPHQKIIKHAEFKAGLFIIITVLLFLFIVFWLRYFTVRPDMTIYAQFVKPEALTTGIQVFYKGVNVGKIRRVRFADDLKSTIVEINLYMKNLRLPANITAKTRSEGIAGQKYIELLYPENPSKQIISDKIVIKGQPSFSFSDIEEFLKDQFKEERVKRFIDNMERSIIVQEKMAIDISELSANMNQLLNQNEKELLAIIRNGAKSTDKLNKILADLNQVTKMPEFKKDLSKIISSTGNITGRISNVFEEESTEDNIKDIITNLKESTVKLNTSMSRFNTVLGKTSCVLDQTRDLTIGNGVVLNTLNNTNATVKQVDCFVNCMEGILNKRFALLRLMFGKPGKAFEKCMMLKGCNNYNNIYKKKY